MGHDWLWLEDHCARDCSTFWSVAAPHRVRIRSWRLWVQAAEARKAEDASIATRRTPRRPSRTGRLAWIHCESERLEFIMSHKAFFKRLSNICSVGWPVQGEERRVCRIFGALKD